MSFGLAFWILMLIWLILGGGAYWPSEGKPVNRVAIGGHLLLFVIILILGWSEFGAPLQGGK